jgi:hypothetical protein
MPLVTVSKSLALGYLLVFTSFVFGISVRLLLPRPPRDAKTIRGQVMIPGIS